MELDKRPCTFTKYQYGKEQKPEAGEKSKAIKMIGGRPRRLCLRGRLLVLDGDLGKN